MSLIPRENWPEYHHSNRIDISEYAAIDFHLSKSRLNQYLQNESSKNYLLGKEHFSTDTSEHVLLQTSLIQDANDIH